MELPLFPLNTVLFPGATVPLHIFEERYKQMVTDCLEVRAPFGVLLIRRGEDVGGNAEPFQVGTTAHIARIEHLPDGRMNLLCIGGRRFRLLKITRETPYMSGDVEFIESVAEPDEHTARMASDARALFGEYVRLQLALTNQWTRTISSPEEPDSLADYIGSQAGVNLWIKQRILEETSPQTRLAVEIEMLGDAIREIAPRVEAARASRWSGLSSMN